MADEIKQEKDNIPGEQTPKKKSKLFDGKLFAKLKTVKHIEIYIAIIVGAIIVLIYLSSSGTPSIAAKSGSTEDITYTSMNQYATDMERKLTDVLSQVNGAGTVNVMIVFKSGLEMLIAYSTASNETTTTNGSGTTTTVSVTKTPILINNNSEPIILSEQLPVPQSVLVVASGAGSTGVKLALITAVESLLKLPASSIQVLAGK